MPTMMMTKAKDAGSFVYSDDVSILLASDSKRQGSAMHRALQKEGLIVEFAGDYADLEGAMQMQGRKFDIVLLEVTGEHAVELAVAAALRVKRADPKQFLAYLADAHLETSGLAGDAIFPRNPERLRAGLRKFLTE